ncbi:hypothetical protein BDB00DRAFT_876910 [Zychaea mexicana]|uniref:uncharacterized protein n=1 Tax=Zychaea mexicana TaxID=64656 RepID=UPI0022FE6434|nr:uncharacterized protein BDB00DRAFT_876910 [Zychaea mexicana]KAI9488943.1 hypothetical protein BDB00DRAFT_876910 [Zychaea mexicana]
MDLSQLLTLFKSQKQPAEEEQQQQQEQQNTNIANYQDPIDDQARNGISAAPLSLPLVDSSISVPSGMNLGAIDPALIAEVRQEFLSQQAPTRMDPHDHDQQQQQQQFQYQDQEQEQQTDTLDSLLDSLRSATEITPQVLVGLGRMCKETELLDVLRECQQIQHDTERNLSSKRQTIESRHQKARDALFAQELVGGTPDYESLDQQTQADLRKMDMHILREMDSQLRSQQVKLAKLKVPFFKQTFDPAEIEMQHKILSILLNMVNQ